MMRVGRGARDRGIALIEVAIVLVLIGLLIGLGAALLGPLTKRTKIVETREIVDAAVEAIIGYTAGHKCLPGNLTDAGVRRIHDAWGKDLVYIPATDLLPGNCTLYYNDTCGRRTTNLIVKICNDVNCNSYIPPSNDTAFVVISGGPNYNIQIDNQTSEAKTVRIYAPGLKVDKYSGDFVREEEFDDIVKWVTLNELRIKMGCQGPQLRILNNALPYGFVNSSYNATIFAEGGVPFTSGDGKYEWCYRVVDPPNINNLTDIGLNPTPSAICPSFKNHNPRDTFTITGTPNKTGNFYFNVTVQDNQNNTVNKTFVITIHSR